MIAKLTLTQIDTFHVRNPDNFNEGGCQVKNLTKYSRMIYVIGFSLGIRPFIANRVNPKIFQLIPHLEGKG